MKTRLPTCLGLYFAVLLLAGLPVAGAAAQDGSARRCGDLRPGD